MPQSSHAGPRPFATTQWSVVFSAGRPSDPDAERALAELCETYWYPLYAYVRRRGYDREQAQDLTQEFFARLLERETLRAADRERGRFRTFLLASLKNFLASEWRKGQAAKRGGGAVALSLNFDDGEERLTREPADANTPERIYLRRFAMTLLERALGRLGERYLAEGKQQLFESLKPCLAGVSEASYAELGARIGLSEGAVKTAVHRLRKRCRAALRDEVAQTVAHPDEIDDELRELFIALG